MVGAARTAHSFTDDEFDVVGAKWNPHGAVGCSSWNSIGIIWDCSCCPGGA